MLILFTGRIKYEHQKTHLKNKDQFYVVIVNDLCNWRNRVSETLNFPSSSKIAIKLDFSTSWIKGGIKVIFAKEYHNLNKIKC